MCAREYSDFLCLFFAYLVELFFKIGFAFGCKRSVLHVDLSVCAKTVVVERTLACGTLHQTFEVLVEHVLARFDVGKVLRKRSALALDRLRHFAFSPIEMTPARHTPLMLCSQFDVAQLIFSIIAS